MLFREWKRLFEQVSTYSLSQIPSLKRWAVVNGIATRDASQILFSLHTYYSIVVKLLTSDLLAASFTLVPETSLIERIVNTSDAQTIIGLFSKLEDNEFYRRYKITNFLEGDFFTWYLNESSPELITAITEIAQTLQGLNLATAKLMPKYIKDLLKEFYSSLVDEQIRHDLGEYYTPDWLAQYVLSTVGYKGDPSKTMIDPSCGSGTFLN